MPKRQLIVVDLETTSLHVEATVLEVAAVNVETEEELYFVPHVDLTTLYFDPVAMQINRYFERGVFKHMDLDQKTTNGNWAALAEMLDGNTFGGSNPVFDERLVERAVCGSVWHHRKADIANYAGSHLNCPPWDLPGNEGVCHLLGVHNSEPHSALGDARATAECFRVILREKGILV